MFATYTDRVPVHPDRYGVVKTVPNLWAILHTSEGAESGTAAENLAAYMTRPGDRPNGSGGVYGSSYHAVFDTDQVIPAVPYHTVAYSAGGANAQGIHGCFPGKAGQTRAQWLDPVSRAMIRQCAAWLCDIQTEFGIPVRVKMSPAQMVAHQKGLGDHYTATLAFRKSTHTDVGDGFPWDVLADDITNLLTPPPWEPTMQEVIYTPPAGSPPGTPWLYQKDAAITYCTSWKFTEATGRSVPVEPLNSEQYPLARQAAGL